MRDYLLIGALAVFAGTSSSAAPKEVVETFEVQHGRADHQCFIGAQTDKETKITLQLSYYKSEWDMSVWVSNRKHYYREFEDNGFPDRDGFKAAHRKMEVGGVTVPVGAVSFPFVKVSGIKKTSSAAFTVEGAHNVSILLKAMNADGLKIPNVLDVSALEPLYKEFRDCSYNALGIDADDIIDRDFRSDYRRMFEDQFTDAAQYVATARACRAGGPSEADLDELATRAAKAFHPGLFNYSARGKFSDELRRLKSLGELKGASEAMTGKCAISRLLSEAAFSTLEQVVRAAEEVN